MQSNKRASLSQRILNLDWTQAFPISLRAQPKMPFDSTGENFPSDEVVSLSGELEVRDFMRQYSNQIFERNRWQTQFLSDDYSQAKSKYYDEVGDFFIFSVQGRPVGAFVGNILDWSTYYLRSCAILPEYQGRGYLSIFLRHLLSVLKAHGIDRAETEVSPSNIAEIHLLNKFQFNMTGQRISERWGTTIQFTKFLNRTYEEAFLTRFCDGVRPQLAEASMNNAAGEGKVASKSIERGAKT